MSDLKDQLIRMGHQRNDLRPHISPVLDHLNQRQVQASPANWYDDYPTSSVVSSRGITSYDDPLALDRAIDDMDDKEVITRHALLSPEGAMSENDIITTFWNTWQLEPYEGARKGLPRQKGDRVLFDGSSCKIDPAVPLASEYDGKEGTIVETEKQDPDLKQGKYGDVMIQVDGGTLIRYPQGQRKKSIGLKAPKKDLKHQIEVVYIAGGKPSRGQVEVAQNYLDKARGKELRSRNYYSGFTGRPAFNKTSGDLYFGVYANAQRDYRTRTTISLRTGTVLHVGDSKNRKNLQSKREDLKKWRKDAGR